MAGCARILGVDGYTVGGPGPTALAACGALAAPNAKGECETVGVTTCAGPELKADKNGGCAAALPAEDCVSSDQEPMGAYPGKSDSCRLFNCDPDPPRIFSTYGTPVYFARFVSGGAPGADGSKDHPFASIADALGWEPKPAAILLYAGEFLENVDVTIPVHIVGACPQTTRIASRDASRPVIRFGPGAEGASVNGVSIAGDASQVGVAVDRTARVNVGLARIHGVRLGITVDDSSGITISGPALIDGVGERGIVIRGSTVTINQTVIRDVGLAALSPALESAAIAVHPSRHAARGGKGWDPWNSPRSVVTVTQSFIERAPTGLYIEGSTAELSGVVVRDTNKGVAARWRPAGPVAGDVTIRQSVIENSRETGIDIWNAEATIESTTIRGSGSPCPASDAQRPIGAYPGNGVRARYDRVPAVPTDGGSTFDPASQTLTLSHSLVDGSRQAGIHVEGGAVTLDHSLVRGTLPESCTGELGDGVMAYAHKDFPVGSLRLASSRISGSAGPGLATFGTPISLAGVVIDGRTTGIARETPVAPIDGEAICAAEGRSARCVPEDGNPKRSVFGPDCTSRASELDCYTWCGEEFFFPGVLLSGPLVTEMLREPRIAPQLMHDQGCTALGGLEADRQYAVGLFGDRYVPSQGPVAISGRPLAAPGRSRVGLVDYGTLNAATTVPAFGVRELDLSFGLSNIVLACEGPPPALSVSAPASFYAACPTGIQGWVHELRPQPLGVSQPIYSTTGEQPTNDLSGQPAGGLRLFFNVSPGDYEFLLHPPGASGQCTPDFYGSFLQSGVPSGTTGRSFKLRAEAGYANSAAYVYCTTTSP
jgi:hypothetical protein